MNSDEAQNSAEELRALIAGKSFTKVGSITCSIGTTCIRSDDSFRSAFERLDKALYSAKSSGRNCVRSL